MFPSHYPILDIDLCRSRHLEPVALAAIWLDAGVRLFQLRAKHMTGGPMCDLATQLARMAREAHATFIVNDRADVAAFSGAHGVHVGQEDLAPADVRRLIPAPGVVGLSTHTDDQVRAGRDQPVDYLAIGPVFATTSKAQPDPVVGLDGVRRAAALAGGRPLVAIGGITIDQADAVLHAGATSVAIISDLLVGDLRQRVRTFLDLVGTKR